MPLARHQPFDADLMDRIVVMRQGRTAGVVDGPTATEESIMRLAAGVEDHAA